MADAQTYYVPPQSKWPIVGSVALFCIAFGAATMIHGDGAWIFILGLTILTFFLVGWFRDMINESLGGINDAQVGRSYRIGMVWFIGSEVMFFAALFGALFYARELAVPWLGGAGNNAMTHAILYPDFIPSWPLLTPPKAGAFKPFETIEPWGLPLVNTILLVTSSFTITWAHHALKAGNRRNLIIGLILTLGLGVTFLFFQAEEYMEAYKHLDLTLGSGIYGSTFFMLTGFHGMHVTLGSIMLLVMLIRSIKGHFTDENHFAFEATSWYWHFVDVVWLGLFIFVYIF